MPPKKPTNQQRFEILLENVEGKLQVVAEGHGMLAEQMELLKAEVKEGFKDQNRQRELANKALTKRIDDGLSTLSHRIDEVDQGLSQKIDAVADDVQGLRTDIQEKVLPHLDGHESRITALEGKPAA